LCLGSANYQKSCRKVNYLGEKPTNLKEASHLKGLKAKKI